MSDYNISEELVLAIFFYRFILYTYLWRIDICKMNKKHKNIKYKVYLFYNLQLVQRNNEKYILRCSIKFLNLSYIPEGTYCFTFTNNYTISFKV